jgi:hypothetical protein
MILFGHGTIARTDKGFFVQRRAWLTVNAAQPHDRVEGRKEAQTVVGRLLLPCVPKDIAMQQGEAWRDRDRG